jgi:signal transduction histidine kinase/tetratricopeptide (TPR) repeat protein
MHGSVGTLFLIIFYKPPVYFIFFMSQKSICTLLIIGLICLGPFLSFCQDAKKIDSLNIELSNADGPKRCDVLFRLAIEHQNWNNQASLSFALQGRECAISIGDTFRIVKAGRYTGQAYRRVDNLSQSIHSFVQAMGIAERHKGDKEIFEEYKNILNGIAITHLYFADYEKALEFYLRALDILEAEGDKGETSIILNNVGLVYFKLRDYKTALQYYRQALAYKKESKNFFDLDRLYINTGLAFNQIRDYAESQRNFEAAFNVCKDKCNSHIQLEGEFGLGVSNFGQEKYDQSLLHLKKSYSIAKEISNTRFMGENLVYMAKIHIARKDQKNAVETLKEAEDLISATKYNELLIDIYRQYSVLFTQHEDYQNAAMYQGRYIKLKDSIYNDDLFGDLAKIQSSFAERENIKTIANKDEVIQRQRSMSFAIIIIAILASMLIFVLYRSNKVKKKVNQALSDAKAIIEDQNRQLLTSNYSLDKELKEKNVELQKANDSLLRVNEELDNFIYKTSHDIRGPLASLKGMCNVALMDVKDQLALNYLRKLDITAEKLNTILTRLLIVNQINNSTLGSELIDFPGIVSDVLILEKKKGLPPRLKIRKHIDESIEFYSDREFVRIILENLIDNAIKFYNDSDRVEPFVDISVTEEATHVRIMVVDNGIGISEVHPDKIFQMFSRASERSETGGIGLYITKTAAEKLGGIVHLGTTPEGYTQFYVTLPLAPNRVLA